MDNQLQKSSPKDVFMYILNVGAFYAVGAGILVLLFQYVNIIFPDPLNLYFDASDSIRWSLAVLIIIFPVFLWVSRFLKKDLSANPQKSELKIRKWLLYFTLFAAAILIIGDLVTLIYNFLQGELTARFILKILSVLFVAASVFGYYFYDLRRSPEEFSPKAKIFVWSVIVIVIVIVIYGFFAAGSPFKRRLVRFDRQKVNDLQNIQGQIVNFWVAKNRLPQSLEELKDSISGFAPPVDPQTNASYEYQKTGDLSFELCSDFNLALEKGRPQIVEPLGPYGQKLDNWDHGSDKVCFPRTIDLELYRKSDKIPTENRYAP